MPSGYWIEYEPWKLPKLNQKKKEKTKKKKKFDEFDVYGKVSGSDETDALGSPSHGYASSNPTPWLRKR